MDDFAFKSRLGNQAGTYFTVVGLAYLWWHYGLSGLIWRDALYFLVGWLVAAVVVGNVNYGLSRWFERRQNLQDISPVEALMGSARMDEIKSRGMWIGWLLTLIGIGFGLGSAVVYTNWLPR